MALMIFGVVLNRNGWSIDYFGMNTPVEELERAVDATHPDLVVLRPPSRRLSSRCDPSSPHSPSAPLSP